MEMRFADRAEMSGTRRTSDGYLVAEVPVARTGIQDYAGWEMGRNDLARVSVYRPPEMVFEDGYIQSMAHRPVTDDHPKDSVTAANWDGLSKGHTGETVRKDEANGLVFVPMMISDQKLIDKIEGGKREVSVGYTCDIEWRDGVTNDGTPYQAVMSSGKVNHIAVVKQGRAGSMCRIGDSWSEFANKEPSVALKTIKIASVADGMPFEATDAAETIINKLVADRDTLNATLSDKDREIGTLTADKATLEGEKLALETQLADAKVTPEKLERMVADRAAVIDAAKKVAGDDLVTDGKTDAEIRKAAVQAKLGDKTPSADAAIEGAFAVLSAAVADSDPVREAIRDTRAVNLSDAAKAEEAAWRKANDFNAWRNQGSEARN